MCKVKIYKSKLLFGIVFLIVILFIFPQTRGICKDKNLNISGNLHFDISGEPKDYYETSYATITVSGWRYIHFSDGKLIYKGTISAELDNVDYWIVMNNQKYLFNSDRTLTINLSESAMNSSIDLYLHGKVTINQISAQPAGDYEGTMSITVTEGP